MKIFRYSLVWLKIFHSAHCGSGGEQHIINAAAASTLGLIISRQGETFSANWEILSGQANTGPASQGSAGWRGKYSNCSPALVWGSLGDFTIYFMSAGIVRLGQIKVGESFNFYYRTEGERERVPISESRFRDWIFNKKKVNISY